MDTQSVNRGAARTGGESVVRRAVSAFGNRAAQVEQRITAFILFCVVIVGIVATTVHAVMIYPQQRQAAVRDDFARLNAISLKERRNLVDALNRMSDEVKALREEVRTTRRVGSHQ